MHIKICIKHFSKMQNYEIVEIIYKEEVEPCVDGEKPGVNIKI